MAWDSYDENYHLTREGWVLGYDRPTNAVESWTLEVRQPSGWAPADRSWTQTWVKPGIDPALRAALHRRFPRPGVFAAPRCCARAQRPAPEVSAPAESVCCWPAADLDRRKSCHW